MIRKISSHKRVYYSKEKGEIGGDQTIPGIMGWAIFLLFALRIKTNISATTEKGTAQKNMFEVNSCYPVGRYMCEIYKKTKIKLGKLV